jgi:hypothetical protein
MLRIDRPVIVDHSVAALALADGDYTVAALLTALGISNVSELCWLVGPSGEQRNKVSAEAFGELANNTAKAYAVFALTFQFAAGSGAAPWADADSVQVAKLVNGTATIGTKAGAGSPSSASRFADTMTLTKSDYHADLIAALGGDSSAHSPANDTVARLTLGEVGLCDALAFESETGLMWRVSVGA